MGILDDAIREHLELKRRRGADPGEIERLEQEALGPVRRVQENGEPLVEPDHTAVAYDDEYQEEPVAQGLAPAEEWKLQHEEALLPGESWEHEPPPPEPDPEPRGPAAEPPPPAPAPEADKPDTGGETVEYDVEAAHAEGSYGEPEHEHDQQPGEDVLEETPEFLQDTPDHDRLWFEQRPPRDFDFDG